MNLDADDTHLSLQNILRTFKMTTIEDYVSQQRMRWVGHALRRPDYDKSKIAVQVTLKTEDSTWTKLVKSDCAKFKMSFHKLLELAQNPSNFRSKTHWCSIQRYSG